MVLSSHPSSGLFTGIVTEKTTGDLCKSGCWYEGAVYHMKFLRIQVRGRKKTSVIEALCNLFSSLILV
ncbi:unnamed protein product [Brassica rapa]|uniref:Uncharacterized protein n=2 Tax=Brassica TaxID=3705 RepID=A0A8D9M3A6_BRACM|nr:unnamed protein product [Brassica napus]CAG7896112.1 unnamed protein product [Brassica rapa]